MITTFEKYDVLSLSRNLTKLLELNGNLSPTALAKKLNIPANKITRLTNADVTDPKASTLIQIAEFFGVTINQLLGLEPLPTVESEIKPSQIIPVYKLENKKERGSREWYRWFNTAGQETTIALEIDSELYEPTFSRNSILIIDTLLPFSDRAYVVVIKKSESNRCIIRRYRLDGKIEYLYPIHTGFDIEKYDDALYNKVGVMLEVHQKL